MQQQQLQSALPSGTRLLLLVAAIFVASCGANRCGPDYEWFHRNGHCYHWSGVTNKQNWFQSEMKCRSMGSELVTIHSSEQNQLLYSLTLCSQNSWIGMVNTDSANRGSINGYTWWNNSPKNFTSYSFTSADHYNCVMLGSTAKWRNYPCQSNLPYLCYKQATAAEQQQQQQLQQQKRHHQCPPGWLQHSSNCYFVSESASNYFNAQMACESKDATVVSVLSRQEQVFLTVTLGCSSRFWIGLEKSRPCFINPKQSQCWVWMDRAAVGYTAWASGQTTDRREMECAYSQGDWRLANCYSEYRFVCKRKAALV